MSLLKVGKVRLSKSGKALEIGFDYLPYTVFKLHFYAPLVRVKKILDKKILETDISLLIGSERNMICEKPELKG